MCPELLDSSFAWSTCTSSIAQVERVKHQPRGGCSSLCSRSGYVKVLQAGCQKFFAFQRRATGQVNAAAASAAATTIGSSTDLEMRDVKVS